MLLIWTYYSFGVLFLFIMLIGIVFNLFVLFGDSSSSVTPLIVLWCHVPTQRDQNNKPIIYTHKAFVASSGDIITDYNDLHCLFTCRIAYPVCICDRRNDKQQALLYTAQNSRSIVRGKFFEYEIILTGCELEAPDCSCKVGISPLYKNSLCAQKHYRLGSGNSPP